MELRRKTVGEGPGYVSAFLKMLVADEYILGVRTRNAFRCLDGSNVIELRKMKPRVLGIASWRQEEMSNGRSNYRLMEV